MIPNVNFNPSFANLAALRGIGGLPHPFRPGPFPMPNPIDPGRFTMPQAPEQFAPPAGTGFPGPSPMPGTMPGSMPGAMPQPMPFGPQQMAFHPMNNLLALQQLFGRSGGFRG